MKDVKAFLVTTTFVIAAVAQITSSLTGARQWPLAPYDMFAYQPSLKERSLRIRLVDTKGCVRLTVPGRVIPLDFFRAYDLFVQIYVDKSYGIGTERAFSQLVLTRLNNRPWRGFDEMLDAIRPRCGERFVSLEVVSCLYDYKAYRYGSDLRCQQPIMVHRSMLDSSLHDISAERYSVESTTAGVNVSRGR